MKSSKIGTCRHSPIEQSLEGTCMYMYLHCCCMSISLPKDFPHDDPHYRDEVNFTVPPQWNDHPPIRYYCSKNTLKAPKCLEFKPIINWKQSPKAPLISDPTCWQASPLREHLKACYYYHLISMFTVQCMFYAIRNVKRDFLSWLIVLTL